MKTDICPKCEELKPLTKHHVYPKTHFGHTKETELICRDCHDDLERFIVKHEGRNKKGKRKKLPKIEYLNIYFSFLAL